MSKTLQLLRSEKVIVLLVVIVLLAIAWFSGYLPVAIVVILESISDPVPPIRPPTVPQEAIWAGGFDGGVFIDCEGATGGKSCYDCVIYFDHSGEIWMRDIYCLDTGAIALDSLRSVYSGFNGYEMALKDGRRLVPLTDQGSVGDPEYNIWYDSQVRAGWHMETFRQVDTGSTAPSRDKQ